MIINWAIVSNFFWVALVISSLICFIKLVLGINRIASALEKNNENKGK